MHFLYITTPAGVVTRGARGFLTSRVCLGLRWFAAPVPGGSTDLHNAPPHRRIWEYLYLCCAVLAGSAGRLHLRYISILKCSDLYVTLCLREIQNSEHICAAEMHIEMGLSSSRSLRIPVAPYILNIDERGACLRQYARS